jgi:glutamate-1-semialdehyde 2,1-aminomutase
VHFGGAQSLYGIKPDLTLFGKVIGGGLPVGAYGGRRDLMERIAPEGPIYQAGTLSGNPMAMAAGLTTLRILKNRSIYEELERKGKLLAEGLALTAREAGVPVWLARAGSMLGLFFHEGPVTDWDSAKRSDVARYAKFFHAMLEKGVYLAPSQFEAAFLSAAHTDEDIVLTLDAARHALMSL